MKRRLNVVVFGSGSGTNLEALLAAQEKSNFQVRALVTDRKCRIQEIGEREQLPVIYVPFKGKRLESDQEILSQLNHLPFSIDLIVLAGYMRIITPVLLRAYPQILNVHPADLTKCNEKGERLYVGRDAVKLALENGESRTRSTVHLVNEEVDAGAIVKLGEWVEYTGGSIEAHQEKQKRLSDWPALVSAVQDLSAK